MCGRENPAAGRLAAAPLYALRFASLSHKAAQLQSAHYRGVMFSNYHQSKDKVMYKYILVFSLFFSAGCSSDVVEGEVMSVFCEDTGCFSDVEDRSESKNFWVFFPNELGIESDTLDEAWFKLVVEPGSAEGQEALIVKKVVSKEYR